MKAFEHVMLFLPRAVGMAVLMLAYMTGYGASLAYHGCKRAWSDAQKLTERLP